MRQIISIKDYPSIDRIFCQIRQKEEAVFLDSSLQGELGTFSIIACRPYLKLVQQEQFTVNGSVSEIPFTDYLREYLKEHKEANETHLPLVSGAIGYFSYDFGRELAGVPSRHKKTLQIPESILYFYDLLIIEDHKDNLLYLIANGYTDQPEKSLKDLTELVYTAEPMNLEAEDDIFSIDNKTGVRADFTKQEYQEAIEHMIRYIVDGDIYVVNMTQQLQIKSSCKPYEMFVRLREANPSPFGGYLDYGDFQIISASPERFLKMKNGQIKTRPIKGTRKRGKTTEEDQRMKQELADSKKDQSELLMIVDLERNDLNRVCEPGSVKVTELFSVETYATVFHLVANVEGQLRQERNAMDLFEAAFPGGSITGAPKRRAMELIDQEEHSRRNIYTGSIGYLSLNGDCDLNIVIRTAVHKDGTYHIGAGGGITCESDTEFEYEETWQKAAALLRSLGAKEQE